MELKNFKDLLLDLLGPEASDEINAIPDEANDDLEGLSAKVLSLLQKVNTAYKTSRDNTEHLAVVSEKVDKLKEFVELCSSEEMQQMVKLSSGQLQQAIAQLHFKVSNYYSIMNNDEECIAWLKQAELFITQNPELVNTRTHAVFCNLAGGYYSRLYDSGKVEEHGLEGVIYFRAAVTIYRDKLIGDQGEPLEISLNSPAEQHYRHVVMCLGCTLAKTVESRVIKRGILTADDYALLEEAKGVLEQLTAENLVNPDGSPDYYRLAGVDQWKAKVRLYERLDKDSLKDALRLCESAVEKMQQHNELIGGGAIGQLQMIQNDYAFTARVVAQCLLLKNLDLGNTTEPMYFGEALKATQEISDPKAFAVASVLQPEGYSVYLSHNNEQMQPAQSNWFSGWTPGYDKKTALSVLGVGALVGAAVSVATGHKINFGLRN